MILFPLYFLMLMFLHLFYRTRDYLFPLKIKRFGRKKAEEINETDRKFYRSQPKPEWVKHEVMKLKALMPQPGCRKIAHTFNRMFAQNKEMTVSKTFVNETIRKHKYKIQVLRKRIKNSKPKSIPKNLIWGMDLTGKMDEKKNLHNILGIIEHKSRLNLQLAAIKDKTTVTMLRFLLDAIEHFGKPKIVRTDNEPVFASWLFKIVLLILRIKHQPIQPGCPWQNGRIERFFGALKEKLNQIEVYSRDGLNDALSQFRFWYNHVRPHQNLYGRTPAEVWVGKDVFKEKPKRKYWFEAWDGLLIGIYLE